MLRNFSALLLFFSLTIGQVGLCQQVVFPEVILKDIPTDVQVQSEKTLNFLVLNGDTIEVKKAGEVYVMKVQLSNDDIHFENPNISFEKPLVIPGWLSLLPPLIAIVLALIFKEVLSSLFIGIFIGAATIGYYGGGISGIFAAFFTVLDHYILNALLDTGHISVILFSVIIGAIVALISKNGGMQGVVNRLVKFATNRKSGMLTSYFLGLAIFFDDYANTLVVGNTMRPITDRLKISRQKLAYIVDSTAAPIAAVAFITTWIGAELTYISDGISKIELQQGVVIDESAYGIFVNSLGYSFYPVFTLFFVFFMLYKQRDFGPMYKAEKKAIAEGIMAEATTNKELEEFEPVKNAKMKAYNAIVPVFIVIAGTFIGLLVTGLSSAHAELLANGVDLSNGTWAAVGTEGGGEVGFFRKLGIVIGNADSYLALLWASMTGLAVAIIMTIAQRIMNLKETMDTVVMGINTMMPAVVILILAWSLAGVTESLSTAEYLKAFFGSDFSHVWVIPALTFVLSAFIAFSTGSSWSTMALMYPLVIPLSFAVASADPNFSEMAILYNTIASVLAGSVLGDHCSPISDTTILSSLATSCDHIEHVRTQMPYALTVGAVALFVGVIPAAFGVPSLVVFGVGILLLYLIVHFVGKKV
ncbi:Na+/H+ antiporter NhaC family protein [Brumimicrobium aurantiacum]|uniref:Na+/H+ antiporter NhaC family protein n=1 Tax=Brumimicrobium aurantiacum TaxID=1737063 RepID=A0A3E1EXP8_9FLAO|nr:Na+/H+ antiporter NhaC family protein [Brumimicrobium aurantiacum]RFC54329.1 Na+/H+ antiporter NhaC family protein [Brumimicrobium aurantiacum]